MEKFDSNKYILPIIGRTAKLQRMYIGEVLKINNFDLTFEQWVLLLKVNQRDGLNQNELAFITDRNKASLTRIINKLEKKHLVARIPSSDDKRVNNIFLTTNGRNYFEKTLPIIKKAVKCIHENISEEEQHLVFSILQKLQDNIIKSSNTLHSELI